MNKSLLESWIPFQPVKTPLTEGLAEAYGIPGGMIVRGILQRAGAKNHNGRVYPRAILERECKKYHEEFISQRRALGELDHPESSVVNLNNVSHNILRIEWQGEDVIGDVQILNTPSGRILKELLSEGITLGISSRGLGSVKELYKESAVEVQDDFELIAWDFVSNPSTQGAFMRPVNESRTTSTPSASSKYIKTNEIITSILCDDGKCRI